VRVPICDEWKPRKEESFQLGRPYEKERTRRQNGMVQKIAEEKS